MSRPHRVVLVEDNRLFRETLELLLGLRDDIEIVGSVGSGRRRSSSARELEPDVVARRLPDAGPERRRRRRAALLRASPGDPRRLPDRVDLATRRTRAGARGGRGRLRDEGRGASSGSSSAIHDGRGRPARRLDVNLTPRTRRSSSTRRPTSPRRRARFPNWRVVPLYVNFGDESYRDYVDLGPDEFYARLAGGGRAADDLTADAWRLPGGLRGARGRYERILSLQLSSTLSGTFASAEAAAAELGGVVRVDRHATVSAAIAMLALRGAAPARARHDRRGDRRARRALPSSHGLLFTVETLEYLARGGRIGRAAAFAGTLLNVKPILDDRAGRGRAAEAGPRQRRRRSRSSAALLVAGSTDAPVAADRASPTRRRADAARRRSSELVARSRPQAQIEVATSLGAVVGTHAGPGTVGLFWFDDPT